MLALGARTRSAKTLVRKFRRESSGLVLRSLSRNTLLGHINTGALCAT